jgi:hypothetical protein
MLALQVKSELRLMVQQQQQDARHPNVMRVLGADVHHGFVDIFTTDGGEHTLGSYFETTAHISPSQKQLEATKYTAQIASGVHHVHTKLAAVYVDLKDDNVAVEPAITKATLIDLDVVPNDQVDRLRYTSTPLCSSPEIAFHWVAHAAFGAAECANNPWEVVEKVLPGLPFKDKMYYSRFVGTSPCDPVAPATDVYSCTLLLLNKIHPEAETLLSALAAGLAVNHPLMQHIADPEVKLGIAGHLATIHRVHALDNLLLPNLPMAPGIRKAVEGGMAVDVGARITMPMLMEYLRLAAEELQEQVMAEAVAAAVSRVQVQGQAELSAQQERIEFLAGQAVAVIEQQQQQLALLGHVYQAAEAEPAGAAITTPAAASAITAAAAAATTAAAVATTTTTTAAATMPAAAATTTTTTAAVATTTTAAAGATTTTTAAATTTTTTAAATMPAAAATTTTTAAAAVATTTAAATVPAAAATTTATAAATTTATAATTTTAATAPTPTAAPATTTAAAAVTTSMAVWPVSPVAPIAGEPELQHFAGANNYHQQQQQEVLPLPPVAPVAVAAVEAEQQQCVCINLNNHQQELLLLPPPVTVSAAAVESTAAAAEVDSTAAVASTVSAAAAVDSSSAAAEVDSTAAVASTVSAAAAAVDLTPAAAAVVSTSLLGTPPASEGSAAAISSSSGRGSDSGSSSGPGSGSSSSSPRQSDVNDDHDGSLVPPGCASDFHKVWTMYCCSRRGQDDVKDMLWEGRGDSSTLAAARGGGDGELQVAQDIVPATLSAAAEEMIVWFKVPMAWRGWRGAGGAR